MIHHFHSIKLCACFFSFRAGIRPKCRFGQVLSVCKESESSSVAARFGICSKVAELAEHLALDRRRFEDFQVDIVRSMESSEVDILLAKVDKVDLT